MRIWVVTKTFALALAGAGLFQLLGLPLPFLFGPMATCLLAALAGVRLEGVAPLSDAARAVLGIAVGASVTPALLGQVPTMAVTLALIPAYVAVIGLVGVPFFHRLCGLDRVTSYYAAMPGGFQDMVYFGQQAGGDVRALALIHATRVLIIVTLVPVLLVGVGGLSLDAPTGVPAAELPAGQLALMVAVGLAGWKGGARLGLFGPAILGPLILAALLTLAGVLQHRPPAEAIMAAQFFIGTGIGLNYRGVTLAELRRDVAAGAAFALLLAVLAGAFTLLARALGGAAWLELFLSFAPGGQAEMAVLALVAGADLGFVVAHHLGRILLVIAGAPVAARWALRR